MSADAPQRPAAAPPRRRWPWIAAAALLLLLPLLAALGLSAVWRSLHTEAGTRWWLAQAAGRLPGIVLTEPRGALLGADSSFSLARATLQVGANQLRIDRLRLAGLQLGRWQWQAPHLHLEAREVAAQTLALTLAPQTEPSPPPAAPADLALPLTARIERLAIERLQLPGLDAPVEGLSARLEAGSTHRVDALALRWNGLLAEGSAQIDAAAPLTLAARLGLRSDPAAGPDAPLPAWARDVALDLQARGPLARFDADARLGMQAQQLTAKAQLTPFDALPLSQLDARFEQLDLARLLAPFTALAPTTSLSGNALLQLNGDAPLVVRAQVSNAAPGRWDRQRLPLRELELLANGRGAVWQVERAQALLAGDAAAPAGRLSGSGRYDAGRAEARLQLDGLLLQALDRRAPPLRLGGPVTLELEPAPAADPGAAFGRLAFDARLSGNLLGPARASAPAPLREAAQLALRGNATPGSVVLEALSARAGAARLDGKGRARLDGKTWVSEADLTLAAFDPALWLPGEPDAAWRRAGNALNGSASLRARVPSAAGDAAALLAALQGSLKAELTDSRLAGQPLALQLTAEADGAGRLNAQGEAGAAGNSARLTLALRAPGRGATGDELAELKLDAPALARLAPLAEALGLGPLAGNAQLDARADGALGAWLLGGSAGGALTTRGTLQIEALQAGSLQVAAAQGAWNATLPAAAGSADAAALARAALDGRLTATRLRLPGLVVPDLALQAEGTLAEHRASLKASLRQPARAGSEAAAAPPAAPLLLDAALAGNWRAGAAGEPAVWRARIGELALRPGTAPANGAVAQPAAAALPLFVARDLQLSLQHGAELLRLQLEPGSADLLGALLRWQSARWERAGAAPARLALQAEVEPFVVAQLLQRLQPDFGWAGDLRVGARVDLRSEPGVSAKIELARTGGDLQVREFGSVQPLGLSELRLALDAQNGLWQATQRIVGSDLGTVDGRQTVRTDPTLLWPAADAPIEGQLALQVEKLAAWGAWVPAGWRLGGRLDAALRVAGRFGAPELIGELRGRELAVRNTLEGVALSEGEIEARFEGNTARLTTFRFQAGPGELRATGDAQLGEQPQARLEVTAERALLLGRVDRRVVATGQAAVRLDAQKIAIDGRVRADEGLIDVSRGDAPSLGDDVSVKRAGAAADDEAAAAAAARRTPRAVELQFVVDLGPRFRLRGRGIDTRLTGELKLATPSGRFGASGEIRTVDGTYEAYGQKLAIERGVITFVGDIANPRLDIEALRANSDERVGVRVSGNVQSPRVSLFSDPELPATEKLALLVTGRSYDSLAGTDTLLLQRAAFALLAGDGSDASAFDVARLLQLDELSVRQTDGAVRETVVTLGKQISDRVYLGYERGLNAAAGNWQLIYRIAQRFTLRAQSGADPAVDLIWLFRWN